MLATPPAIRVAVNDRQLPIVAVFESGRVLVPFRAVVEALGGRVGAFRLPLPPPARIIAGRTYAPIRYLANTLHAQIQYDARAHLVQVFLPQVVALPSAPNVPSVTFTSQPLASSPPFVNVINEPYQVPLQLNVYTSEVYGGNSVNVQLIAPPGGQAFAFSCTSNYQYQLWAAPTSQYYTGSVPTRRVEERIQCPITAMYVAWNGAVTYAPYPAFVELLPIHNDRPRPTQTPAPTPTPTRVPLPPAPRRTPAPITTAVPTATPKPAPTPTPHRVVPPLRHATPRPNDDPTPRP